MAEENTVIPIAGFSFAVNEASVYSGEGEFLDPALSGLHIMDVKVYDDCNITSSPIETGVKISDSKVHLPRKITITGICDNVRGDIVIDQSGDGYTIGDSGEIIPKDSFWKKIGNSAIKVGNMVSGAIGGPGLGLVADVANALMDHSITTHQDIIRFAMQVFAEIQEMLDEKESGKTYTISTKGAIYKNMVLKTVEQLNDAERLLVIPVTLTFEQLIFIDGDSKKTVDTADLADQEMSFQGAKTKSSWDDSIRDFALSAIATYTGSDIISDVAGYS